MKTEQIIRVSHKKVIVRDDFNPRVKPFTEDLKPSILEHGIRDAVEAVEQGDGTYLLNAQGHRRLLALGELVEEGHRKTKTGEDLLFPIKVVEASNDLKKLRLDIITLNTGKPLELIEEARVYGAILADEIAAGDKAKVREAAKALVEPTGRTLNHIMNLVNLLDATKVTVKLIESGKVSASLAIELFLAGKTKGDWAKVEEALVEAAEDAAKKGKKKVTKKDTKNDEEEETAEERKAREEEEEEERQDRAEQKARLKELQNIEKRAVRLLDNASEIVAKVTKETPAFDVTLSDLIITVAAFLVGKPLDSARKISAKGEPTSAGDVTAAYRAVLKEHNGTLKETVKEVKTEAKEKIADAKSEAKAKVAAVKEAIKS